TTVVEYIVRASDNDVTLNYNPYLSFKNPGQAGKKESLKFDREVTNNGFKLVPQIKKDVEINIFATEGTVSSKEERITENVHYDVDERTGDVYLEAFYVPGTISVTIPKNTIRKFYIIATIEKELKICPEEVFR
ncbi:glycogen debranching protein, partial [Clostridium perfringens]|uniref:glycogen debranching enzyme N-terminal domain-containing protein n=1 Tax=Clostridium perfringens TaxID=1502 RepID=UPI002AC38374